MTTFIDKLTVAAKTNKSLVCIGLDPDYSLIPHSVKNSKNPIFEFNKQIIDTTTDLVCCYKPNAAFYEAKGLLGIEALEQTISYIPKNIPVILDAKRGDIGNTCEQYAIAYFDHLKVDAVTVSPYMGYDSISPFAEYSDKTPFILVKTSNKSSGDLQNVTLSNGKTIYVNVAELINQWQEKNPAILGAVVGATYPEELKTIREILPDAPILIPGLGAQGGDAKNTIINGLGPNGTAPIVVSSSRGIIFASKEADFAAAARRSCLEFRDQLNSYRN